MACWNFAQAFISESRRRRQARFEQYRQESLFDTLTATFYNLTVCNNHKSEIINWNKPMPIPVGSKAPDFSLKSKNASGVADVKLSGNLGKKNTVILFFPLAFTGVCTQEMCDITAGLSAYSGLNAEVIAISVDSPFAQEAWAKQHNINLTLASDLNKTTAKAYGVLLDDLMGFGSTSARAAFVVDKNGVVQYSEQTPTPKDLPNFNAVKDVLARLK
jgi:peroxiredoxin